MGDGIDGDEGFDGLLIEENVLDDLFGGHIVGLHLLGYLLVDNGGVHIAGADGIGGDAEGGAFQRQRLGKAYQAMLGGDVGALELGRYQAVGGGDVDDAAKLLLLHLRPDGFGEVEGGGEVDGDDGIPLILGEVFQRGYVLDAGIVDKDVYGTERIQRFLGEGADGVGLQHVGGGEDVFDPELVGHALGNLGAVGLQAVKDDVVARLGKYFGHTKANAAGAAGDEDVHRRNRDILD